MKDEDMGGLWQENGWQENGKRLRLPFLPSFPWFPSVQVLLSFVLVVPAFSAEPKVDFAREIRPLLAKKCFACHGPDEEHREGGLRLDIQEGATKQLVTGAVAVVAGKIAESELTRRISSSDDNERMPPQGTGITLTEAQKGLFRRWIEEGASYAPHWAYVKPIRHPLPEVKQKDWPRSNIDSFVLAKLEQNGLAPMPPADKYALIRRVSLDLRGLPPTPREVEEFVKDEDPQAFEKLVDKFMADPAYGERWARMWMDQARYADSRGYGSDPLRPNIWRYRDWIIDAFNANKPFDQFTTEQIAGDLLPNATLDQKVATAFHRNTMTNTEGGTDDEEFRVAAVKDRVDTTINVWMGLTMGCAKCHNHKYEPITHKEYYQFYALFNQTADSDKGDDAPFIPAPSGQYEEQLREYDLQLAVLKKKLEVTSPELAAEQAKWEEGYLAVPAWQSVEFVEAAAQSGATFKKLDDNTLLVSGAVPQTDVYTVKAKTTAAGITAFRLETIPDESLPGKSAGRAGSGNFVLTKFAVTAQDALKQGQNATARFVRIELPGSARILHLAEVQVFSSGENAGQKGKATQSSTDYDGTANLANDGNTDGKYYESKSVCHTKQEDNPWWEVDLGADKPLDKIAVWNRVDSSTQTRLQGYKVLALDAARNVVWQTMPPEVPQPSSEFAPSGVVSVALSQAVADHSQDMFPVANAIKHPSSDATGWGIAPQFDKPHQAVFVATAPVAVAKEMLLTFTLEQKSKFEQHLLGRFRLSLTTDKNVTSRLDLPAEILAVIDTPADKRSPEQFAKLAAHFRTVAPSLKSLRDEIAALEKTKPATPTVPVMQELAENMRRPNYIMLKGNFLAKGEAVEPLLPTAFHQLAAEVPRNRLMVAQWLLSPENPLTARVAVNRFWAQLFGAGIVETEEDFGIQGEQPSHPEMLDNLALHFQEDLKWDMKALLKTIVMSRTYQQSSKVTVDALAKDPRNRLLSRGARFRLEAEMVRDQALSLSGLLSRKMHGPSVYPPQPEGLWQAAFNGERTWQTSKGEDRFRRGLYTFWRRTVPYPSMATFDAPSRETCSLRRIRTNTPLQAFVTMNDPAYVEASQALARRIMKEGGATPQERAAFALKLCLVRPPSPAQVESLLHLYLSELAHFQSDAAAAKKLATDPLGPAPEGMSEAELAAWTVVANVVLNLDGVMMKG
jgi:Protein of unknown function (DUF1553)/Protein of unknown function (DUF1549)/Planctomycete cytochrome C/F5/8 type C domain